MRYDVSELITRFDHRTADGGHLTGLLSSLVGEDLLIDVYTHYLQSQGRTIVRLEGRPERDNAIAPDAGVRYLDAWLLLDQAEVRAVECKTWTASSLDGKDIVGMSARELVDYAKQELATLSENLRQDWWNQTNKVALPLIAPRAHGEGALRISRALVVWRPISYDGESPESVVSATTVDGKSNLVPVDVHVFSVSLYLRQLAASGVRYLPTGEANEGVVKSIDRILQR